MSFQNKIFLIATIWYAITAYFSSGYYHADEHYQLIEFAGIFDNSVTPSDLTWEYKEKIRPAIQPFIAFVVFKVCAWFSINNEYTNAFILRLLTCFLAVFSIRFFTNSCRNLVSKKYWKLFLILSYFLWFLPFINVRFSSETWSGLFFLLAISLTIRDKNTYKSFWGIGTLIGISFLFRYQIAIAAFGLILWLLIIRKTPVKKVGCIVIAGLSVLLLGIVLDLMLYGQWTFTAFNYFSTTLLSNDAPSYGTEPWYYYFFLIFRYSFFPFGLLILFSTTFISIKKYKSIIVWIIVPFILAHTFITHKELRFLFPLVNLLPLFLVLTFDNISTDKWKKTLKYSIKGLGFAILLINFIALFASSIKPAGVGRTRLTEKIKELNNKEHLNIFYATEYHPYSPWKIKTNFYKEDNAIFKKINPNNFSLPAKLSSDNRTIFIINIGHPNFEEIKDKLNTLDMHEQCKSMPDAIIPLLKIYGYKTNEIEVLYSN